jgi:predicted ribosomally synthesized peptide with SipW-like signal peptide
MRKHKILIVALAIAVMLTGAGYAYWSQTITIDNTVNTGNMDVGFLCPDDEDWDDGYITGNHSDLVELVVERAADRQSIDFTVNNFYPGAGASLDFVVKNTGTVAAKISQITGNVTSNQALCDALNYQFTKVVRVDVNRHYSYYDIQDVNANNVPDLATGLTNALDDIILQPGDVLILVADNPGNHNDDEASPGYNILMPSTISGTDFENQSCAFSLAINFTQVN